jgi:uncharacterized protein (UPF0332 family)
MNTDKLELVNFRIKKAKETLQEIDVLVENKYWNNTVNRLYYACFHAVTALLAQYGIDSKTHSGVQNQLSLHFVKANIIDKETGKFFATLFEMRQAADYEDLFEYEKEDVLKLIPPATNLISQIAAMLAATDYSE